MSRFTVEFSPSVDRDIDEIAHELGVTTKADVVRKALNLLKYVVRERKEGAKFVLENERQNTRKEIVTL
jgi:hypothetical protein